ncbi:MAG TPA: TIGR03086 family protein [Dehalococcoidia bacterium]|nr:TIGR03086 family protein [Dehalococcoidia bacterium]
MSPAVISDCYMRSLDSSINFVANVPNDALGNDTPCSDWDVKAVVNHIVYENVWMITLFSGRTIAEVGDEFEGDLVGDDPAGVYARTAKEVKAILYESDAMTRTCQISSGPVSGTDYAKELSLDTLIHGWDIAVGSKQDATLDDYLVKMCMPFGQAIADSDGYGSPAFKSALRQRGNPVHSPDSRLSEHGPRREQTVQYSPQHPYPIQTTRI